MATKYKPFIVDTPFRGLIKDRPSNDVGPKEFINLDHFHFQDGRLLKYPGWEEWDVSYTEPAESLLFGLDVELVDGTRRFITLTKTEFYHWTHSGPLAKLNSSDYTGTDEERWQVATMNDKWYFTNATNTIQEYNGTTVVDLSADASLPTWAYYIENTVNHLMLAHTSEGGTTYRRRLRWSDIEDPSIFIGTDTNEADFFDFPDDIGVIRGIKNLGQNSVIIYGSESIYQSSYIGLPWVFTFEKRITDEGLYAPYSLASVNDVHFFLGKRDFYQFMGGSQIKPLGFDRVISHFWGDYAFDSITNVYSFVHPYFKEVWWVYKSRQSVGTLFDRCLVYNWQSDTWSTRNGMNMTFIASILSTSQRTIADATNPISQAVGTWREKQGKGIWRVISGADD